MSLTDLLTDWLGESSPKVSLTQDRLPIEHLTQSTLRWPAKLAEGERKKAEGREALCKVEPSLQVASNCRFHSTVGQTSPVGQMTSLLVKVVLVGQRSVGQMSPHLPLLQISD